MTTSWKVEFNVRQKCKVTVVDGKWFTIEFTPVSPAEAMDVDSPDKCTWMLDADGDWILIDESITDQSNCISPLKQAPPVIEANRNESRNWNRNKRWHHGGRRGHFQKY